MKYLEVRTFRRSGFKLGWGSDRATPKSDNVKALSRALLPVACHSVDD